MLSCAQRSEARALTIPQLESAGLNVKVFLDACNPIGRGGNGPIGLEAVRHAIRVGGPHLVVEDDIDLAPDFTYFLDAALETEAVVYFYLHDRPDRMRMHYGSLAEAIEAGKPLKRQLRKPTVPRYLFGSQCVLIPEKLMPVVESNQARYGDAFDGNIQRAITQAGWPVLVALPHPVQHRHDRTARTPDSRVKRSLSFDLPRLGDA